MVNNEELTREAYYHILYNPCKIFAFRLETAEKLFGEWNVYSKCSIVQVFVFLLST